MSSQILVIEYEPRYTDRVREAVDGLGVSATYARDGDEALAVLQNEAPSLVILSSVIPRWGTADLVRRIRSNPRHQKVPILLTMSGYTGSAPVTDAAKFGATDILPKPFTAGDLKSRLGSMLGLAPPSAATQPVEPLESAETVRISRDELMAEMDQASRAAPAKPAQRSTEDEVDRILADTLSGLRVPQKRTSAPSVSPEKKEARKKTASEDLDQLLHDTLSGLERTVRFKTPAQSPTPPPTPEPPAAKPEPPAPPVARAAPPPPKPPEPTPEPEPFADEPEPEAAPEKAEGLTTLHPASRVEPPIRDEPVDTEDEEGVEGERFGQYVLVEKIATGGMAEVWKARMRGVEGFEKIVAIKKILPHLSDNQEFVDMFIDEAKLAAQLNHNNIIHIYDLGKIADSYYIAMEYIDGHDLKSILKRSKEMGEPMPVSLALSIAAKLAGALDYAHRRRGFDDQELGIVHRDVSPQNVLISYEGDIKLCDFGIAKAATKASHTQAGALKGKLQYMSPEQAWGRPIDRRSDIFSVSAVLFEMLSGRKLFTGESELSILDQVREASVVAPSTYNDELGTEVDAIVLRGLEKDPAARYGTAGEMAKEIESVLYDFRPAPTSADLAIFMHRLFETGVEPPAVAATLVETPLPAPVEPPRAAPVREPRIEPTVQAPLDDLIAPGVNLHEEEQAIPSGTVAMPSPEPSAAVAEEPHGLPAERPAKSKMPLIAAVVVLLIVAGAVGGWYMFRPSGDATPAPATTAASPASSRTPAATGQPVVDEATPITPESEGAPDTVLGAEDLAKIDQEVQKRLDEQRRRLEAEAEKTAPAPATTTKDPEPKIVEQTPSPQPAAPADTSESTPPPAETKPQPTQPPPAQPAAPEPKQAPVKEGDLVQPGTPGLVEPELISMKKVGYPAIAKRQRVEGLVIIRALISETGKVIEAEILRGVPQNVGINEAAMEMVKGSSFKPATKDGVKVKAYHTISIPFKL